jgi:16S rRNA (uracil1498-N3)-methyltransferase
MFFQESNAQTRRTVMHRFHFDPKQIREGLAELNDRESLHAKKVLRLGPGDLVELFDGAGNSFQGIVSSVGLRRVLVAVRAKRDSTQSLVKIGLAVGVIKPERMEWMLEKACELGVYSWSPVLTERVAVRLAPERWKIKVERWRKIALESCKQCGQSRIPRVQEPTLFKDLIPEFPKYDAVFIPTLAVDAEDFHTALSSRRQAGNILILIGPEGDFSKKEAEKAIEAGAAPVSFGELVMRAETAAIFALSAAQFFYRAALKK